MSFGLQRRAADQGMVVIRREAAANAALDNDAICKLFYDMTGSRH